MKKKKKQLTGRLIQERYELMEYLWNKGLSAAEISELFSYPISRSGVHKIVTGGRPGLHSINRSVNYKK